MSISSEAEVAGKGKVKAVNLKNANFRVGHLRRKIAKRTEERNLRAEKFDAIYKCLAILLDAAIVNMAIVSGSFIRTVLNFHVHDKIVYERMIADALARMKDLIARYPSREGGVPPADVEEVLDKLKDIARTG